MKNFLLIFQGLYSEVSGPTFPYLKERSDSNFEQISHAQNLKIITDFVWLNLLNFHHRFYIDWKLFIPVTDFVAIETF